MRHLCHRNKDTNTTHALILTHTKPAPNRSEPIPITWRAVKRSCGKHYLGHTEYKHICVAIWGRQYTFGNSPYSRDEVMRVCETPKAVAKGAAGRGGNVAMPIWHFLCICANEMFAIRLRHDEQLNSTWNSTHSVKLLHNAFRGVRICADVWLAVWRFVA